jgi:hypothetical protein
MINKPDIATPPQSVDAERERIATIIEQHISLNESFDLTVDCKGAADAILAALANRPSSAAVVEALKPFAKYQMGMVGIADVVRRQDFKGFAWVAAFNGPTQPEFRHFEAARAVITQSRNDHEGSQS